MLQDFVSDGLIAMGFVAVGTVLLLLVLLLARLRRETAGNSADGARSAQDDLSHMRILLQTMRDMLDQQKALAREFNKSLDGKVTIIRKVVRAVADEHTRLNETHQELNRMTADTKADLAWIRAHVAAAAGPATGPMPDRRTPGEETVPPSEAAPAPPLLAVAAPLESRSEDDLIEDWVGLDFGTDEPDPYAFDVPSAAPEVPEDPEAAREAFRTLLNLADEEPAAASPKKAAAPAAPARTNGRRRSRTLRARVLEYSDAGMSVPEIARELGLGKGEVRLILSIGAKEAKHRGLRKPDPSPTPPSPARPE